MLGAGCAGGDACSWIGAVACCRGSDLVVSWQQPTVVTVCKLGSMRGASPTAFCICQPQHCQRRTCCMVTPLDRVHPHHHRMDPALHRPAARAMVSSGSGRCQRAPGPAARRCARWAASPRAASSTGWPSRAARVSWWREWGRSRAWGGGCGTPGRAMACWCTRWRSGRRVMMRIELWGAERAGARVAGSALAAAGGAGAGGSAGWWRVEFQHARGASCFHGHAGSMPRAVLLHSSLH